MLLQSAPQTTESAGRVLVVDDDPDILKAFKRILVRKDYQVTTTLNSASALSHIQDGSLDVLVCDLSMPEMNGIELLRRVRAMDAALPVILVTGAPELDSAIKAVEYGAMRYLTKPVAPTDLTEAVRRAISLRRLNQLREKLAAFQDERYGVGDLATLEVLFDRALQKLYLDFQPIVCWSKRKIVGYEALVRSTEPGLPHPGALLDAAERLDRIHDLGRPIRALCRDAAQHAPDDALLFINLHTRDLLDESLYSDDEPLAALADRVVLEVTERARLEDVTNVTHRLALLRERGYRIALDDIGAGYSGLNAFAQLEPEVVKIDMALVRNVDRRPTCRKLVGSLTALCTELGMTVVAEGVETGAERDAVAELGCSWMQGYLFARPGAPFVSAEF